MKNIEQVVPTTKSKKGSINLKKNPWANSTKKERRAHLSLFSNEDDKKAFLKAYRKEHGHKFLEGANPPVPSADEKLKDKNLEVVKEKVKEKQKTKTGKFLGIDYDSLGPIKQKALREKARDGMFKIIDPYLALKKIGKHKAKKTEMMEAFKEFVNSTYNSAAVSKVEDLFIGRGERKENFDAFIQDFKAYLAQ